MMRTITFIPLIVLQLVLSNSICNAFSFPTNYHSQQRLSTQLNAVPEHHYHEYTLETDSNPTPLQTCQLTQAQIHTLIAKRLECRKKRQWDDADKILQGLNHNGVHLQDKARKYRIDGDTHFGRRPRYVQRGGSYGLEEEDVVKVQELVEERARCKRAREYHKSDRITDDLKNRYRVKVNDKNREWSVVVSNWDNNNNGNQDTRSNNDSTSAASQTDNARYVPTPLASKDSATHTMSSELQDLIADRLADRSVARRGKDYRKADRIRDQLMEEYFVLIDDRTNEWKIADDPENLESDSFLVEARLSQRSAFVRRQEEATSNNDNGFDDVSTNSNINSKLDMALSQLFDTGDDKEQDIVSAEPETTKTAPEVVVKPEVASELSDVESLDLGSVVELSALTVVALKEKLREAGLPVSGKKADLIERLMQ